MSISIRGLFKRDAAKPSAPAGDRRRAQELVEQGIAAENSGATEEALQCYRRAIEADAGFAPAHMNLGIALQAAQDLAGAMASYHSAIALDPAYAAAHYNLGLAHLSLGEHAQAEDDFRAALRLRAEFPEAWVGLADALEALEREPDALAALDTAIRQREHYVGALLNAGALLRKMGRLADAEARRRDADLAVHFAAVLRSESDPQKHNDLGNALQALDRLPEAEASFRRALELNPGYPEAHYNLGNALRSLARLSEAEVSYRHALDLKPDFCQAHNNLGIVLEALDCLAEAESSYRSALEVKPDFHEAHYNLGNTLQALGRLSEALACYRRALELKPDYVDAHIQHGNALRSLGRPSEAGTSYRHALQFKPDCHLAHSNLGISLDDLGRTLEAEASFRRALELKPDYHEAQTNLIFTLNYRPDQTAAGLLTEAENYGRMVASKARAFSAWSVTPAPSRRLRVGLVSGDLKNHPVSYFLESFLPELSGEQIELYAYQTHVVTDAHTQRLKHLFAAWRPVFRMNDEQLAQVIFDDAIDILIDLSGHTAHNRLPVFAWKPAPVQLSWLGYFGPTGVPGMDYVLGDPYVTPAEDAAHFSETIWRLPETHLCFTPPDVALGVTAPPALRNGFITFGCFNNLAKMNDTVVAVWAEVLAAVPGSTLFLKASPLRESSVREHVVQRFAGLGVAADRLVLESSSPRAEMLEAYARVDIALDPFPYPGGTISMEALWMGVPVLTRRGERFWSRVGEGIARKAGLADWVAADDEDYVKLAASHAAQVNRLSELRAKLRAQVLASPMFDAPRFARHFEAALRGMWQRWCR